MKTYLITGSTQGLGSSIAYRLAADKNVAIAITGRQVEKGKEVVKKVEALGASARYFSCDLRNFSDLTALVPSVVEHFGRLDSLINSAAVTYRGSIEETTLELYDSILTLNVKAPFFLIQDAVKQMQKQGDGGTIVNILSDCAIMAPAKLIAYGASKAALANITITVAASQKWHRIRSNGIRLGWTNTEAEHEVQKKFENMPDNWVEEVGKSQPFGRIIEPKEVAELVYFLSTDLSGVMTGALIDYDQHLMEKIKA